MAYKNPSHSAADNNLAPSLVNHPSKPPCLSNTYLL
jgi:hypothetical protein